jgi:acyl-homoserine lactone acylase PvdQ
MGKKLVKVLMIKFYEMWIDEYEEIYYYVKYYDKDDKLNYYWWDNDCITDKKLIKNLNKKRKEYDTDWKINS